MNHSVAAFFVLLILFPSATFLYRDLNSGSSSQTGTSTQMSFPSGWQFVFFHSNLLPGLANGSKVTAGQLIGYANLTGGTDFDIAFEKFLPTAAQNGTFPFELDSIFNHMSPAVLQDFTQRGVSPANAIISKAARDASPCTSFTGSQDDWVVLDGPTTSTTTQGNETFIFTTPVDLSQINQISKFRSCYGHDYSGYDVQGYLESNRSMKHYFAPLSGYVGGSGQVKEFAPFNGTIDMIFPETQPRGNQVWITPSSSVATTTTSTTSQTTTLSSSSTSTTTTTPTPTTTSTTVTSTSTTTTTTSSTTSSTTTTPTTSSTTSVTFGSTSSSSSGSTTAVTTAVTSTAPAQTTSLSTSGSTTTTTTTSARTATSTSSSSTNTGAGGIPEYPYQALATFTFALLLTASYLLARRSALFRRSATPTS